MGQMDEVAAVVVVASCLVLDHDCYLEQPDASYFRSQLPDHSSVYASGWSQFYTVDLQKLPRYYFARVY